MSSINRRISRIITVEAPTPGFIGAGHLAAQVVNADDFPQNDPFILLMDDWVDIGDRSLGGAHPHAGFETVTLVVDGAIRDRYEGGVLSAGDVQWMTAGKGVIHSENVEALGKVRILQLWLTLPKSERWTTPGFQDIRLDSIPIRREPGVEVRLYSGTSGEYRSATRNHVPVTLADITVAPGASFEQDLPASYNGFAYVLSGSARLGSDGAVISQGQVGWLDRPAVRGTSVLRIAANEKEVRLVLYAGEPQNVPISAGGPFIGDSREDIARLYTEFRQGRFARMSELVKHKGESHELQSSAIE